MILLKRKPGRPRKNVDGVRVKVALRLDPLVFKRLARLVRTRGETLTRVVEAALVRDLHL